MNKSVSITSYISVMYLNELLKDRGCFEKAQRGMICIHEWTDGLQRELTCSSASSSSLLIFRSSSNILQRHGGTCVTAATTSRRLALGLIWHAVICNSLWKTFLANGLITQQKQRWLMFGNEEVDSGRNAVLLKKKKKNHQMFSFWSLKRAARCFFFFFFFTWKLSVWEPLTYSQEFFGTWRVFSAPQSASYMSS